MAGNILYIPYSLIMIIGLIVVGVILYIKKGKTLTRKYFVLAFPVVLIFQLYFWNIGFNNYVKSYLFASEEFHCELMDGENSISLPERTVLQGKEDVCSPFYTTYSTKKELKIFFDKQFEEKVSRGQIKSYKYLEDKGYIVELTTSEKIVDIFFTQTSSKKLLLTMDYHDNVIN